MVFDGTTENFQEIRMLHPSAAIYPMQRKLTKAEYIEGILYGPGSIIFDPMLGSPMLVIRDRISMPERVFEIGQEVE